MANIKVSQLPAAAAASGTQEFETNDGGTSKKVTGSQLKAFVKDDLAVSDITDLTASAAELNVLDGITASTTELNYTEGVTSNIQTQLNSKASLTSPAFTGTPSAPTASAGTNTTQLATTAFVTAEISNDVGVANSSVVKTALNASGSAPIYACRAWVNFNGTGTVAIRASGNVSSITDNGVGDYTVNFTTAMQDANYAVTAASGAANALLTYSATVFVKAQTTASVTIYTGTHSTNSLAAYVDMPFVNVSIFR